MIQGKNPYHFKVTMSNDIWVFNRAVPKDLMYIDDHSFVHRVNKNTSLDAAFYLAQEKAKHT